MLDTMSSHTIRNKSKEARDFIFEYGYCMGKLEELEMNLFYLNEPLIKKQWEWYFEEVDIVKLSNWYDTVEKFYNKIELEERREGYYNFMLETLSQRISTCIKKIALHKVSQ